MAYHVIFKVCKIPTELVLCMCDFCDISPLGGKAPRSIGADISKYQMPFRNAGAQAREVPSGGRASTGSARGSARGNATGSVRGGGPGPRGGDRVDG